MAAEVVEVHIFKLLNWLFQESGRYVYKDVFVNVLALPPDITNPPQVKLQTVTGSSVKLTCDTFGAPKPIVKWFRGQDELTGNRYNITEDGSLVITDVKYVDDGDYMCNATNKFGHEVAHGSLIVKDHTRITQGPQPYEVEAGDTATFRCNAVTDPDLLLQINWLKDGRWPKLSRNANKKPGMIYSHLCFLDAFFAL